MAEVERMWLRGFEAAVSRWATNFKEITRHDMFSTVIFPEFIYAQNRRSKIDKVNMLSPNLISTRCSTKLLNFKLLPKPRLGLNMLR